MWTFSRNLSKIGKLSGVKQPRPPVDPFLYKWDFPSNLFWQKAKADDHMWAKSLPTTYSLESGPYGSTFTLSAGVSTL